MSRNKTLIDFCARIKSWRRLFKELHHYRKHPKKYPFKYDNGCNSLL